MSASTTLVKVTKEGDSLFGKIFKVLRADAEHVVAEIETEVGKLEALFHTSSVSTTASNAPDPEPVTTATTADVESSDVALQTATPNVTEAPEPAIPLPAPSTDTTATGGDSVDSKTDESAPTGTPANSVAKSPASS